MLELLIPLRETISKSIAQDLERWLKPLPNNTSWYLLSDYCFGDRNKRNDVASFSVLLNHDKIANIKECIRDIAPNDIKSSRNVDFRFLQYINSPVIYHFTFIISRETKFLRDYATSDVISECLQWLKTIVKETQNNSPIQTDYWDAVYRRIRLFEGDIQNRNFNEKLARQILLVGIFAGIISYYLELFKLPSHLTWVSDRDAIIERYDGFIYDFAYFTFLQEYNSCLIKGELHSKVVINNPLFKFIIPERTGKNDLDELIRIPDFLAGTLADLDIRNKTFSKDKYNTILFDSLVNSNNHAIVQIDRKGTELITKRLSFTA